jgi:sulfate permease, SulP family
VVVAMLLALGDRTRRSVRPRDAILGREPGIDHWIPTDVGRPTEQVPGVVVYLVYAPLWYANADYIRTQILQIIDSAPAPTHALVFDANAISDIDYTGARAFGELTAELKQRGVTVAIARASHLVHHDLKHSGLLQHLGPDHICDSVEEAVAALASGSA